MRVAQWLGILVFVGWIGCQEEREATTEPLVREETPALEEGTERQDAAREEGEVELEARAMLESREGEELGSLRLSQVGDQVVVAGDLRGLDPGHHGLHIHEVGDCTAPDFTSAGEHLAPLGLPHGGPSDPKRHAGDLGNIEASEAGTASFRTSSDRITLEEGSVSVIGRAVVVHAGRDDLKTQPSGDSGARIACGVIQPVG